MAGSSVVAITLPGVLNDMNIIGVDLTSYRVVKVTGSQP